ncbi:unnamed protein product, partial [marine sediment metagenome]
YPHLSQPKAMIFLESRFFALDIIINLYTVYSSILSDIFSIVSTSVQPIPLIS